MHIEVIFLIHDAGTEGRRRRYIRLGKLVVPRAEFGFAMGLKLKALSPIKYRTQMLLTTCCPSSQL